jgi:hypothetical protein
MFFVVFRKFDEYVAKTAVDPVRLTYHLRKEDPNLLQVFSKAGGRFWVLRRVEGFNALPVEERARLGHSPYSLLAWLAGY